MAERRKLIVVSNRGPVSYSRENGERVARRGGGGLVTALRGLVSHHDVTWIASAITDEDRAAAVLEELEAEPDAAVLFHDYHLYLAPRFVREEAPDATLSHFVHIPWPQPDYWRILPAPMRQAIHDGLLANDVIGFHSSRWRLAFLRCAVDIAGAA